MSSENSDSEPRKNLRLEVFQIDRIGPQSIHLLAKEVTKESSNESIKVILEGIWTQGHLAKQTIIHLINPSFDDQTNTYTVNNSSGLLVIDPDSLLTCTLVASSLFCERKTWLNSVFLGQVGTNRAMLVGTLVHEVFQHGVKNKIADLDKLTKYLDDLLDDATIMLEIYSVELHMKDIRAEALNYLVSVKEWIEKYMLAGPRYPLNNDSDLEVKVLGVCDIEENVWSTKYGLKGKIDVTGAVRVYDRRTKVLKDKTLPLELKTGNPNLSASHAAQVSLYSMMIEDRYAETNQGLVIYLKDRAAMHNVSLTHNIRRDLVQRRNQINYHMKSNFFGPDMIDQPRMCKNCERVSECILMSNMYKPGDIDNYPSMKSIEKEAVGHLDDRFVNFFKTYHEKLSRLMTKLSENGDCNDVKSPGMFWTYSSEEAEANGTGFGKLQAEFKSPFVTFRRHPQYEGNFLNAKSDVLAESNNVTKKRRIDDYFKPKTVNNKPLPKPFNTQVSFSRCRIAISLDEDISSMDSQNSSTAIAIGFLNELQEDHFILKLYEGTIDTSKPSLMYRIDKIEKKSRLDIERLVLIRLLENEWSVHKIRQLILDPKYVPDVDCDVELFILTANFEEITELEADNQKLAVGAVSTDNYFILNKKSWKLISVVIRMINQLNRNVLVVALNIDDMVDLMKFLQKKSKFILIDDGKSTKARFQYASHLVKVPQGDNIDLMRKYETYIKQHETAPVVLTTYAMSIGGLLFTRRKFDYCIALDCEKIELLVGLSPMFCSNKFIIVDEQDKRISLGSDNVTLGQHLSSLRAT